MHKGPLATCLTHRHPLFHWLPPGALAFFPFLQHTHRDTPRPRGLGTHNPRVGRTRLSAHAPCISSGWLLATSLSASTPHLSRSPRFCPSHARRTGFRDHGRSAIPCSCFLLPPALSCTPPQMAGPQPLTYTAPDPAQSKHSNICETHRSQGKVATKAHEKEKLNQT